MTRKCVVRPAAQAEIDHQADYLAEQAGQRAALRFLSALAGTIKRLLRAPGIGAPWISEHSQLQGIRRQPVAGFPNHFIFYRHDAATLEVLHLYHGRQNISKRLGDDVTE